jgi:hypothetical protein
VRRDKRMEIPNVMHLVVGVTLLSSGYKLFWLFVGSIGFAAGYSYAHELFSPESDLLVLFVAMIVGLVGALLAVFLQRVSIVLAGFLGGGYIALNILPLLGIRTEELILSMAILGGILGAGLLFLLFDWALILLSSLLGALLVVQAVHLKPPIEIGVFFALFTGGAVIQAGLKRGDKKAANSL